MLIFGIDSPLNPHWLDIHLRASDYLSVFPGCRYCSRWYHFSWVTPIPKTSHGLTLVKLIINLAIPRQIKAFSCRTSRKSTFCRINKFMPFSTAQLQILVFIFKINFGLFIPHKEENSKEGTVLFSSILPAPNTSLKNNHIGIEEGVASFPRLKTQFERRPPNRKVICEDGSILLHCGHPMGLRPLMGGRPLLFIRGWSEWCPPPP